MTTLEALHARRRFVAGVTFRQQPFADAVDTATVETFGGTRLTERRNRSADALDTTKPVAAWHFVDARLADFRAHDEVTVDTRELVMKRVRGTRFTGDFELHAALRETLETVATVENRTA